MVSPCSASTRPVARPATAAAEPRPPGRSAVASEITPFEVHGPQGELDDLRERLARTRWLDEFPGSGWAYGASGQYLQEVGAYWRTGFDWRACEARLNSFGQVAMDVDGQRISAIHARSPEPEALPLLLV